MGQVECRANAYIGKEAVREESPALGELQYFLLAEGRGLAGLNGKR